MSSVADLGNAEREAAIKFWTRQLLTLPDDEIVTVSEFNCGKPTCPNLHTVIMVMSQDGPKTKMVVNKIIADINEFDILEAYSDALRRSPA